MEENIGHGVLFWRNTYKGGKPGLEARVQPKLYYIILGTHIPLAGMILSFILFTAYRGLIGEYTKYKKLARITWPVWLYVAITGVAVYLMISPYY